MHFILDLLNLSHLPLSKPSYISIAVVSGIFILMFFSYLLFVLATTIFNFDKNAHFEYTLVRRRIWAWIYVFNCFWLSGEIIASWQLRWVSDLSYFLIPAMIFIFSAIMSIVAIFPFRKKKKYIEQI